MPRLRGRASNIGRRTRNAQSVHDRRLNSLSGCDTVCNNDSKEEIKPTDNNVDKWNEEESVLTYENDLLRKDKPVDEDKMDINLKLQLCNMTVLKEEEYFKSEYIETERSNVDESVKLEPEDLCMGLITDRDKIPCKIEMSAMTETVDENRLNANSGLKLYDIMTEKNAASVKTEHFESEYHDSSKCLKVDNEDFSKEDMIFENNTLKTESELFWEENIDGGLKNIPSSLKSNITSTENLTIHSAEEDIDISSPSGAKVDIPCTSTSVNHSNSNKKSEIHYKRPQKNFKCEYCQQCFARKDRLTRHLMIHTSTNEFKCNECQRVYIYEKHFAMHQKTHHKMQKCVICLKNESEKFSFLCQTCVTEKSSIYSNLLSFSDGDFKCNFCGLYYRKYYNLVKHLEKHNHIKKSEQNSCNSLFSFNKSLQQNIKINCKKINSGKEVSNKYDHTKLKEFQYDECLVDRSMFRKHYRNRCELCKSNYVKKSSVLCQKCISEKSSFYNHILNNN